MWKLLKFLMTFCGVFFFGSIAVYIVAMFVAAIAVASGAL